MHFSCSVRLRGRRESHDRLRGGRRQVKNREARAQKVPGGYAGAHVQLLQLHESETVSAVAAHEVPLGGATAQVQRLREGLQDAGVAAESRQYAYRH